MYCNKHLHYRFSFLNPSHQNPAARKTHQSTVTNVLINSWEKVSYEMHYLLLFQLMGVLSVQLFQEIFKLFTTLKITFHLLVNHLQNKLIGWAKDRHICISTFFRLFLENSWPWAYGLLFFMSFVWIIVFADVIYGFEFLLYFPVVSLSCSALPAFVLYLHSDVLPRPDCFHLFLLNLPFLLYKSPCLSNSSGLSSVLWLLDLICGLWILLLPLMDFLTDNCLWPSTVSTSSKPFCFINITALNFTSWFVYIWAHCVKPGGETRWYISLFFFKLASIVLASVCYG